MRPRLVVALAVGSVGLTAAVWLPTRFDNAEATERRGDRDRSGQRTERFTFTDDFGGRRGEAADPDRWTFAEGDRNARLDGEGNLVLTARRAGAQARLVTRTAFADDRGRVEARIKVADDQGIRSALELLGVDQDTDDLAVMDNVGSRSKVIRGAFGDRTGTTEARRSFAADFHTFAVDWAPGRIAWSVDGDDFLRSDRTFDAAFTPELSLTVGSERAGAPDDSTRFPQRMVIDFVRVAAAAAPPPATTAPTTPPTTTPPTSAAPAAQPWAPFRIFRAGDRVTFHRVTYQVKETHTALPGWEPSALPTLFQPI
jgi:hypothetical protein